MERKERKEREREREKDSPATHVLWESGEVTRENACVDLRERVIRRECDVEHAEQRDEPRVHGIAPSARHTHRSNVSLREVDG